MSATFKIIYEGCKKEQSLFRCFFCFQYKTYLYDDDRDSETGFRFIWRRPDGTLQVARRHAHGIQTHNELIGKYV